MLHRWTRWVLLAGTAGVGAALFVTSLVATQGGGTAAAAGEYVIDILPDAFNPAICQVNRNGSTVKFRNQDTKPRRVHPTYVGPSGQLLWDTGYLDPGETWQSGIYIDHVANIQYRDADNPSLTGTIVSPLSNDAPSICDPLPPTPTPTPTFTPSPTPSATVTQQPPRCVGAGGCAVAPNIAQDGEPEAPPTPAPTESPSPEPTESPTPPPDSDTGPA